MATPIERFETKYRVDPESGCWVWTASLRTTGYAQFRISPKRNGFGHIFAYEHYVGPVPEGRQLHHLCRNRACVNPAHLVPLAPREHLMSDDTPARRNSEKTCCPQGHEYTPENTYRDKRGSRNCRTCLTKRRRAQAGSEEYRRYQREYRRKRYAEDEEWRERLKAHAAKARERRRARTL